MKYELNQERIEKIAQPMSELQGVVNYLAFAGHPHLSSTISLRRLSLDLYCDTIAEMYACLQVTKHYMKSNWHRSLHKGFVPDQGKYYCISYSIWPEI